jgi:hypothetical protein
MPSFHFVTRKRVWLTANVTLPPSIYLRDIVPSGLSAIRFSAYSSASIGEEAERCYAKSRSQGAGSVIWPYLPGERAPAGGC